MSFESKPTEILLASDINNMGSTVFCLPGNITNVSGYCIQAIWSDGSPVGIMSLQASIDSTSDNWSDIPNSSLPVPTVAGETNNIFNVSKHAYYNFVRLKYTRTSGNGILVVSMVSKS